MVIGVFAVGEALFNPILSSSVADFVQDENRGGIMGGLSTLKATANTVAPAIVGFVVVAAGFTTAFLLPAVIGFVYAGFMSLVLDVKAIEHAT